MLHLTHDASPAQRVRTPDYVQRLATAQMSTQFERALVLQVIQTFDWRCSDTSCALCIFFKHGKAARESDDETY